MRYIVRADASKLIGAGHVMRSSTIAEELIDRGAEVIFIGNISEIPWLRSRTNNLGFSQILSDPKDFIPNSKTDVLILDSYTISINNSFIQPGQWRGTVAIADELTPNYLVDLVIRPGLSSEWPLNPAQRVLAGPNYIPFRKSISLKTQTAYSNEPTQVIVVGGGTDPFNFVQAVCHELRKIEGDFRVSIFTNDHNFDLSDSRFTSYPVGHDLDAVASFADLALVTASTISLEFIARGIALGIGCAVDNQEMYYESFCSLGVASPIGRFHLGRWELDNAMISKLVRSSHHREILVQKSYGLIDLKGAERIVDEIAKY